MYLLYFKRLTIINILIRIKTDSFKKKKWWYLESQIFSEVVLGVKSLRTTELDLWGQVVFFFNERLNNNQLKGFGDIP